MKMNKWKIDIVFQQFFFFSKTHETDLGRNDGDLDLILYSFAQPFGAITANKWFL